MQVRVDGHISSEYYVSSGVLQDSHLGPILFNIFVNDIGSKFQSEYLLYADDLKIYRVINSVLDSYILQNDIDELFIWCQNNKVYLNIKKCAMMSFSRSPTKDFTNYCLCNEIIYEVDDIKDFGIIIDNKLTFV